MRLRVPARRSRKRAILRLVSRSLGGQPDSVRYRIEIKEEARQQLRALPKEHRRNIGWRLDALQDDLAGDVKKLTARTHEYRLRVGNFRVLYCWKPT